MLFLGCVSRETLDQRSTNDCRPDPADDLEGTPQRDPIGSCSAANRQSPVWPQSWQPSVKPSKKQSFPWESNSQPLGELSGTRPSALPDGSHSQKLKVHVLNFQRTPILVNYRQIVYLATSLNKNSQINHQYWWITGWDTSLLSPTISVTKQEQQFQHWC